MKLRLLIVLTLSYCIALLSQGTSTELVDMAELIPKLKIKIKYATTDNFTKQKLYPIGKAFGTLPVTKSLNVINDSLAKQGLGIMIFDGYRPRAIQWFLWDIMPNSGFVADPRTGSRHNRGCAMDLTLYDLNTGEELAMPTPFDEFSERANHNYQNLPEEVIKNRAILKNIMTTNGFDLYNVEWWHYEHIESFNYPLKECQMR